MFWHPFDYLVPIAEFRRIFYVSGFLFIICYLMRKLHCTDAVRWAYICCVFVNFIIYIFGIGGYYFGEIYIQRRFQGTFENSNEAALVFFTGMIFCFYEIYKLKPFSRVLAWSGIFCSNVLILSTGSKKGMVLLLIALLVLLPSYLKGLGRKGVIFVLLLLSVLFFVGFKYQEKLGIDKSVELVTGRWRDFGEGVSRSQFGGGSTAERQYFIKSGLEGFLDSPILGHGLASFAFTHGGRYSHCNYVELLYDGGLIAFFSFYGMHLYFFRRAWRIRNLRSKIIIIFPVLSLLLIDIAAVTFTTKFMLYILFLCIVLAEQNSKMEEL